MDHGRKTKQIKHLLVYLTRLKWREALSQKHGSEHFPVEGKTNRSPECINQINQFTYCV